MTWKCPQCGVDSIAENQFSHRIEVGGCGYVRLPAGMVIKSDVTGKEMTIRVGGTYGGSSLKILADPDIKFVSAEQFFIEKSITKGGWLITSAVAAQNPIYLNGLPIHREGVLLGDMDKLSIKNKFFRVTIHLLYDI